MKVNIQELSALLSEAAVLSNKEKLTDKEVRRSKFLALAIPAMRSGATLDEINRDILNAEAAEHGLPQIRTKRSKKQEKRRARGEMLMQMFRGNCGGEVRGKNIEYRVQETEGSILSQLGTYTGLGQFVPTDLYANIRERMAEIDALLDPDVCTVINDTNGSPKRITFYNDTLIDTAQVSEAGADPSVSLLQNPGHAVLGSYGFRTPVHPVSMEACQDIHEMIDVAEFFERFASQRLARAIGAKMINGNGTGQTLGLISALQTNNAPAIVAQGSGNNDGVGTASNSIGSQDMANLMYAVNAVYRDADKAAFLMASATLLQLTALLDKEGRMLNLVKYESGKPTIYGKPIHICPSMPPAGQKDIPVVFGDVSYWTTRIITDSYSHIRVLKEADGLIQNGNYGLQMFLRADGVLATDTTSSNSPMSYLIQHS